MKSAFAARYGAYAVVAGASEGLGEAFAHAIAARGVGLVLLARRAEVLERVAAAVRARHGVDVRALPVDLARPDFAEALREATRGVEVGLGIYNAAYSTIDPFVDRPLEDALRVIEVNCAGPLRLAHALAPAMIERRRGGLVLMASIAGFQGVPRIAAYAASKAFNTVFAEGLWYELRGHGVDVLAACPGAIRTPAYLKTTDREVAGTMDASEVASNVLDAIGRGPTFVPGAVNKLARFFLGRMLSRRNAVHVMGASTAHLRDASRLPGRSAGEAP
ncbi:MAG: SDR family NAD(P)-dependent oxidoreductase [Polyangiaceae bacterium]